MRRIVGAAVAACVFSGPALADDYDGIRAALDAGDSGAAYGQLAQMGDAGDTLAALMMANLQLRDGPYTPGLAVAEAWFEQAAGNGSIEAMLQLGAFHEHYGNILAGDYANNAAGYADAIHWYDMAVDAGSPVALTRLGLLYATGMHSSLNGALSPEEESSLARDFLERAVEAGQVGAMPRLARLVKPEDRARFAELMITAASAGDQTAVGWILDSPGELGIDDPVEVAAWAIAARSAWQRDPNPRSELWQAFWVQTADAFNAEIDARLAPLTDAQRTAAEARAQEMDASWPNLMPGHSDAAAATGGYDAVRAALNAGDLATGAAILAAMGDGGDTLAMLLMADLQIAHAVEERFGLGVAWLEQAAAQGNVQAMLQLGALFERSGQLLRPDRESAGNVAGFPEAVMWYQRAADAGSAEGLLRLGALHRVSMYSRVDPSVTAQDEQEMARDFLTRAADAGLIDAYPILAMMLRRDDQARFVELTMAAALAGEPSAVGMVAGRPQLLDIEDPVEIVAWAIAAKVDWGLARHPLSPVFMIAGASSIDEFDAAMDAVIDDAAPDVRVAAQARADEITADWVSYLPGRYVAKDDEADAQTDAEAGSADGGTDSLFGGDTAPVDGYPAVRAALEAGDYDTAYATLAAMGDAGDTLAMTMLANLQLGYTTASPNFGLALAWLEHAADAGSIHAMIQLGAMYQFQAPAIDREATQMGVLYPAAVRWYQRAIDAGSDVAISRLGLLHRLRVLSMVDDTVTPDDEDAWTRELLARAAEAGRPEAMSALAMVVRRDDPERGGALMREAAALGDPTALGILSIKPNDFGVDDPAEALAWVLAAETRWNMDRDPRSGVWVAMDVATVAEFRAWVAAERSAASPELLAAAEARAAEISAGWTSLLPGQSGAAHHGGLFGRN